MRATINLYGGDRVASHKDKLKTGAATPEYMKGYERIYGKPKPKRGGRTKFMQVDGKLVEIDLEAPLPPPVAPMVFSDITPHRSTVTGEMVTTRSRHRQILRENGLVEVGNENLAKHTPKRDTASKGIKEDLQRTLAQLKG